MKKLKCIMLIDDNENDNFYHERIIKKNNFSENVIIKDSAEEALKYLTSRNENIPPDLIFLDINMPGMNGWDFLSEYEKLDKELQSKIIVVMLTTSNSPEDKEEAKLYHTLTTYKTKPLTPTMLTDLLKILLCLALLTSTHLRSILKNLHEPELHLTSKAEVRIL